MRFNKNCKEKPNTKWVKPKRAQKKDVQDMSNSANVL